MRNHWQRLAFLLLAAPIAVGGQALSLGTVRTEAEKAAMRLAVEYAESVGEIFAVRFDSLRGRVTIVDLSPELKINTGEADAFSSVVARVRGNIIRVPNTTVAGIPTPCGSCFFNAWTVSAGVEADRGFNTAAAIAEVGWVPWYQNALKGHGLIDHTSFGLTVQAGYKTASNVDTTATAAPESTDGAADESEEAVESGLLRIRAALRVTEPIALLKLGDNPVSGIGSATVWRDLSNKAWYYRLTGGLRITLAEDRHFDFVYEKGSGAPNFNEGEQFSANLTIVL